MITFEYKITDELGIHARPAGLFVNVVKALDSDVTIEKDGKSINASKLIALMGLGVKKDDIIKISIDGGNEELSKTAITNFLTENL